METQRQKDHDKIPNIDADEAWKEYQSLPDDEWRKDHYYQETGGYVATHVLKEQDNTRRPGIVAEVTACYELAATGKHVLRLPENKPELIDAISIAGKPYRELLKFKSNEPLPRGYPDVYFDYQTWDFKTSTYHNVNTIRQLIKDGRKADNVIFIITDEQQIKTIINALERELGNRKRDKSWVFLPDLYSFWNGCLKALWEKKKGR